MKHKIFITGSAGLVGSALYNYFSRDYSVYGVDLVKSPSVDSILDVSSKERLRKKMLEIMPDIVIHSSAIKSIEKCESNRLYSWDVNVGSTANIVQFAHSYGTKVIYMSSDVVFDGVKGNYLENDLPNPINWYGVTKYHGELLVSTLSRSAICRTALVLANQREEDESDLKKELSLKSLDNQSLLPFYIIEKLKKGRTVEFSDLTISSPTDISLLGIALGVIIKQDLVGMYHLTGSESISRYNFAMKIANLLKLKSSLIKKSAAVKPSIRPQNLSMDIKNTYKQLGLKISDWNVDSIMKNLKLL